MDSLYFVTVIITLSIAAALLWARLSHGVLLPVGHLPYGFKIRGGLFLTALAVGVLLWRIWMVCRYRAYAPVEDKDLPAITIIIPAYNEGRQVYDTVRSIMASDYPLPKMQVICVDDGSADDTWQWMQKAKQAFPRRLQLIRQRRNGGKRHALMAGFRRASGDVWITIDSDSEVLPHTLRHLVSPFVADARVGAAAGNVRILNADDGAIPKMMDVNFTVSFDFIRSAQSVYGGVFCTPGALSAYRASVIRRHLPKWSRQTFMGIQAMIGEDRALTNCVIGNGYRVVYQRDAVVLTKMPLTYGGLRRMLLRWARSNVRESLVMTTFLFRRFRSGDSGGGYIRFFGFLQLFWMVMGEALKVNIIANLFADVFETVWLMGIGCLLSAILPAVIYHIRYKSWLGWLWAMPYAFFSAFGLFWISSWGLLSASRSGWLTRGLVQTPGPMVIPGGGLMPIPVSVRK
jgi:hyaluronan synthase